MLYKCRMGYKFFHRLWTSLTNESIGANASEDADGIAAKDKYPDKPLISILALYRHFRRLPLRTSYCFAGNYLVFVVLIFYLLLGLYVTAVRWFPTKI